MAKPRIFVGSSAESVSIAHAIQDNLEHDAEVVVWDQSIFGLSSYNLEALSVELQRSDFGVFVFTPEDDAKIRGEEHRTVRDNVLFELGLFMGHLGKDRSFIVQPREVEKLHLPTDLIGINVATYDPGYTGGNLRAALGPACNQIREKIYPARNEMLWPTFCRALDTLAERLDKGAGYGGFRPHLIIGVNQGGAIVGGFLYYYIPRVYQLVTLWTQNPPSSRKDVQLQELSVTIKACLQAVGDPLRILLVDDSFKSGTAMGIAQSYLKDALQEAAATTPPVTKIAVLVYRDDWHKDHQICRPPDYYIHKFYTHFPYAHVNV
ncbi:MAG: nucleotide-binding protein [Candidatus Competibacteraceae bacterium]